MRNELVVRCISAPPSLHSADYYQMLQTIWRFIDSDTKHSYEDILAMDKQIRKIIGRLPKVDAEGNVLGTTSKRKNALAQSVCLPLAGPPFLALLTKSLRILHSL